MNLVQESQVDYVMRALPDLEELNGLPVERDLLDEGEEEEEGEGEEDQEFEELGEIKEAGKETSSHGGDILSPMIEKDNEATKLFLAPQDTEEIKDSNESPEAIHTHHVASVQELTPYDMVAAATMQDNGESPIKVTTSQISNPDTTYDISLPTTQERPPPIDPS